MDLGTWLTVVSISVLGAMSPGPSLAVVLRHTLQGGRGAGTRAALAHGAGVAIYAFATISGLALLITASPTLFRAFEWAGAAYLAWLGVRGLMARMSDAVARALESTQRIRGYAEEFEKFRQDQEGAARALTWSAAKHFVVSLIVLGVALGGAFVNFQLIALPMSELEVNVHRLILTR